ncbi:hypothetical protein [Flagellimonas sp.]|uniref:hypothetical protein n=1 Tax=Flagellimonas sp. TaxID=2058762 RepID=UPI003BB21298
MKTKNQIILSSFLLTAIIIFGFTHRTGMGNKDMIMWSEKPLVWEDFELVRYLEKNYVATVYSDIACPNLITENDSKVYAFMNPNQSERLRGQYDSENVLIHEQYHFNITEYCARLLRKEIVNKGLGGLSLKAIKELKSKYSIKLDSLQTAYDDSTDHNANWEIQKLWERRIDDWLRQTSYYKNEDIYSYYDFTKNQTRFFRRIYFTHTLNVLTSYAVGEKDIEFGNTYEVSYKGTKEKIVKFYKNGKLLNGGYFDTAVTKIIEDNKGNFEIHYLNPDETYNQDLKSCLTKIRIQENQNRIVRYFDYRGDRIVKQSIYETVWEYNSNEKSYYATYLNKAGKIIPNKEGIFHEKRVLDEKDRTVVFENYDRHKKLKNDTEYIARRELEFNQKHQKIYYRLFDESEEFAFHLADYHLAYDYDERGNTIRVTSLDKNGEKTYDDNGASVYEYTYDLYDRDVEVKRFNKNHLPVVANDDYFQKITEYDSLGRIEFEAKYYPEKVLKYNDLLWGATKFVYEGDSVIKEFNLDAYGDLIENKNQIAIIKKKLNQKKETVSETYFGADGNFAKIEDGIVEYRYRYNTVGNKIETASYDSIGRLKPFEADVAIIRWDYDINGHKSRTTYLNANNQLAVTADSVTYNVYKYNKAGNLLERTNYDIDMKPALIEGVFKTRFLLNKVGLDSIKYEYNSQGKLNSGVAETRFYYNKYNHKIRTEYFDSFGRRAKNPEGISAINTIYDKRQFRIGIEYFNEFDQYANSTSGISIQKWKLDELGHTLSFVYLDKSLNPVIGPSGYHKIEYQWAAMGESSRIATLDVDLSPIEDKYGTAIYEYNLRPCGLYKEVRRFNEEGELSENNLGVAISQYTPYLDGLYYLDKELDANGNEIEEPDMQ